MRTQLKAISFFALSGLVSFSSVHAKAAPLASVAQDMAYLTNDLYNRSVQMGDYGSAVNDLYNLAVYSDRFARSLWYHDYQDLSYAFNRSYQSWGWLRVYNQERNKFYWVERDMREISSYMQSPGPGPQPGYTTTISAQGSGGTTHGDKPAACQRATERAYQAAENTCSNQGGTVVNTSYSGCSCKKESGSQDDYNCHVTATVSCRH